MTKVDMSPEAVTVRLKRIEQLRRLCLSLRKTTFPILNKKEAGPSPSPIKGKEDQHSK